MDQDIEGGYVLVSHLDGRPARKDDDLSFLPHVVDAVSRVLDQLWALNRHIHDHPELGFHEFTAHDRLTAFLAGRAIGRAGRHHWAVHRAAYGMRTAWVAQFDSGEPGPVVSFNIEMDALPGIGHACGHNLIAVASMAAGLAAADTAADSGLGGKVVLFGTPAEESGGGKKRLLAADAYHDYGVDVSLISHPSISPPAALVRTSAYIGLDVSYYGHAAHAAAAPWEGINALDALVHAYNGLSLLRQQTTPSDVIQGYIKAGGVAPNIIHEYAAGEFVARASSKAHLHTLRAKVEACFRAGAEATGARVQIQELDSYADHVPNRPLAKAYTRYWNALVCRSGDAAGGTGDDNGLDGFEDQEDDNDDDDDDDDGRRQARIPLNQDTDEANGHTAASTDQGDVSYAMPSISVNFAIRSKPVDGSSGPGGGPHSVDFERATGTREAFLRAMTVAKALAGTALDVLARDGFLDEVKQAWEKDMKRFAQ